MRRPRVAFAAILAPLLTAAVAVAAQPPLPTPDASRGDRTLLRQLHFEYGLVVACGLADDEVKAGYEIRTSRLEQRLGIDNDADARYRELNLGWTEADADWAAEGGAAFREWCRDEAVSARDRFVHAFRETGETLTPQPKAKKP